MDLAVTEARTEAAPAPTLVAPPAPESSREAPKPHTPATNRIPAIIVGAVIAAVATLSIYYLVRGEPLLVQGEADATRFDIAARVDGRVGDVPVVRGQNVDAKPPPPPRRRAQSTSPL
jgi:HlyD family secretion protein